MTTATLTSSKKNLDLPDHVREIPFGRLESVNVGQVHLTRITLQPGWRWSEHVRPTVGTESCQAQHIQYVLSGRLVIQTDDGERLELGPNDFAIITPGHKAWVIGDEPFVCVDFSGDMKVYAEESEDRRD
ncbi:MAG: cupin domain-containing protein [Pirellulales bacterium]